MLFNSLHFAVFFPVVFVLYWFVFQKNLRYQNLLLLVSSYFFYGCWDWRFLFLLIFSTVLDYYTGIRMAEAPTQRNKKFWFWLSVCVNLGFLGVFKYYNFFAESFAQALANFGLTVHPYTLQIILPVGISFYTFHGLSYVIDIYKDRIKAEKDFVDYAVFVSFFPLLVAGPIERATHLLPQIKQRRIFSFPAATDGMKQILWGLFKKVVIADNCAHFADIIFENPSDHSGSTLALGAVFFAFQIYGDFSGYSDIALGTARLLGIDLLRNFAYPYFSRDIAEFWRRWHISLSSWFKDYLYIPLGGSKGGHWMRIRNTFIIFVVSGFWHGANWTFIIWGALNALFIMPSIITSRNRNNLEIVAKGKLLPGVKDLLSMGFTFVLACIAWVFFRAENVTIAIEYLSGMVSRSLWTKPVFKDDSLAPAILLLVACFVVVEWFGREQKYAIANLLRKNVWCRWAFYYLLVVIIFLYAGKNQQFIYFQF
ncbi:MBOAT family O-acyltransferase [Flavobacterium caeni]|nr:MBOAT family O-acyltransferase [Flavobacterium caeni]